MSTRPTDGTRRLSPPTTEQVELELPALLGESQPANLDGPTCAPRRSAPSREPRSDVTPSSLRVRECVAIVTGRHVRLAGRPMPATLMSCLSMKSAMGRLCSAQGTDRCVMSPTSNYRSKRFRPRKRQLPSVLSGSSSVSRWAVRGPPETLKDA
jgi:hypothetical protein